jgi:hypothetical protein
MKRDKNGAFLSAICGTRLCWRKVSTIERLYQDGSSLSSRRAPWRTNIEFTKSNPGRLRHKRALYLKSYLGSLYAHYSEPTVPGNGRAVTGRCAGPPKRVRCGGYMAAPLLLAGRYTARVRPRTRSA